MVSFIQTLTWRLTLTLAAILLVPISAQAAVIVVDIGHSKTAQGSVSATGYGEFLYNRALSVEIIRFLRANGHQVDVLNLDGSITSLSARPARASALKADLFVSIHHDSIQKSLMSRRENYRGYSVWASGSHASARASLACGTTIASTMKEAGMIPGLFHADKIQGEGHQLLNAAIGLYRRDNLAVLRLSKTPAVLIEAGVIVNPIEEAWLNSPKVRTAIARAIASGIDTCVRRKSDR